MKKNLFISAIVVGLFFIASCEKKDHDPIVNSQTINVELKQNQSYSFTIPPSGDQDDIMAISQQAQHALANNITPDAARNTLFEYTPAKDYTGSDEIHVSTVEGEHHDGNNGGHHDGNCQNHGNETETNYIFKINITGTSVPSAH